MEKSLENKTRNNLKSYINKMNQGTVNKCDETLLSFYSVHRFEVNYLLNLK